MSTDVLITDRPRKSTSGYGDSTTNRHWERPASMSDEMRLPRESIASQSAEHRTSQASDYSYLTLASDYIQLTKPRIAVMILVTTIASVLIASGGSYPLIEMLWLLLGTGLVAGSAGAANQVWERNLDHFMPRTAVRPLPSQRMSVVHAIGFTAVTGCIGSAILFQFAGVLPMLAGIATWLLYVLVYTPMKTRTSMNTTVGAIAGALPIMIGHTAGGGTLDDPVGWLLVGILAAWQYPHFMAIAWLYRRQYDEAGFCMSTTVDPSGRSAGLQSIFGSLAIAACGVGICILAGFTSSGIFASVLVALACYPLINISLRFLRSPEDAVARKMLRVSLLVLPVVLVIVTLRVLI